MMRKTLLPLIFAVGSLCSSFSGSASQSDESWEEIPLTPPPSPAGERGEEDASCEQDPYGLLKFTEEASLESNTAARNLKRKIEALAEERRASLKQGTSKKKRRE